MALGGNSTEWNGWDLGKRRNSIELNVCFGSTRDGPRFVLGANYANTNVPPVPSASLSLSALLSFHNPNIEQGRAMDLVAKYTACLSKWQLNVAPGWQTAGALVLLAAGSMFVVSRALLFVRVLLSLFVLPGKPVSIQLKHPISTSAIINHCASSSAPLDPKAVGP